MYFEYAYWFSTSRIVEVGLFGMTNAYDAFNQTNCRKSTLESENT